MQFDSIFTRIKKSVCEYKQPSSTPRAVLLGGQPGAGKSTLSSIVDERTEDYVFINGDSYKSYHPDFGVMGYSPEVQSFSNKIVERLIEELSDEKYNLVIEGTMRNVLVPMKTAKMLGEKGYISEAYVIAACKEDSWNSTLRRAEAMVRRGLVPRYVSREIHDEAAEKLPENVKKLCDSGLFEDVMIMNREKEELYRFSRDVDKDPSEILSSVINHEEEKEETLGL